MAFTGEASLALRVGGWLWVRLELRESFVWSEGPEERGEA
jgi:hypothetical protein